MRELCAQFSESPLTNPVNKEAKSRAELVSEVGLATINCGRVVRVDLAVNVQYSQGSRSSLVVAVGAAGASEPAPDKSTDEEFQADGPVLGQCVCAFGAATFCHTRSSKLCRIKHRPARSATEGD